jgi:hypothetical protein
LTLSTRADAHYALNLRAAAIANSDTRLQEFEFSIFPQVQASATSNMFQPILGDGLGLQFDEAWLENPLLRDKTEFIEQMREIAVDAVRQALVEEKDLFVGLILGEARKGRNYFGGTESRESRPPDTLF